MSTAIRDLLHIPDYAPAFRSETVTEPDHLFRDTVCEDCTHAGAVYVEFAVYEPGEGIVKTDAMFCAEHAGDAVLRILEREDLDLDHGVAVSVNPWAITYGAFEVAA